MHTNQNRPSSQPARSHAFQSSSFVPASDLLPQSKPLVSKAAPAVHIESRTHVQSQQQPQQGSLLRWTWPEDRVGSMDIFPNEDAGIVKGHPQTVENGPRDLPKQGCPGSYQQSQDNAAARPHNAVLTATPQGGGFPWPAHFPRPATMPLTNAGHLHIDIAPLGEQDPKPPTDSGRQSTAQIVQSGREGSGRGAGRGRGRKGRLGRAPRKPLKRAYAPESADKEAGQGRGSGEARPEGSERGRGSRGRGRPRKKQVCVHPVEEDSWGGMRH